MYSLRPGPQQWIDHGLEEGRIRVEVSKIDSFEFKSFALEVIVQELNNGTLSQARAGYVLEIRQDLLGGLARGLVDDRLLVRVRICQV